MDSKTPRGTLRVQTGKFSVIDVYGIERRRNISLGRIDCIELDWAQEKMKQVRENNPGLQETYNIVGTFTVTL